MQSKAFWANTLNYFLGLPLAIIFGFIYPLSVPLGLSGLWIGFYIAQAMIGVYFWVLLKRVKWVPIHED